MPTAVVACVGGGSNAIGAFAHYIEEPSVRLIGVEPEEAASLSKGVPAVLHGFKSYVLQDEEGNLQPTYSIAAGLDYQSVGPEHSYLRDSGRGEYVPATGTRSFRSLSNLITSRRNHPRT